MGLAKPIVFGELGLGTEPEAMEAAMRRSALMSLWVKAICHFLTGRAAIRPPLPRQAPHSFYLARMFYGDPGYGGEPIGWSRKPPSVRTSAQLAVAH